MRRHRMLATFAIALVAALMVFASTPASACQPCLCRSWQDYLPDGDGGGCRTSACNIYCALLPSIAEWSPLSAGFQLEAGKGTHVVSKVYKGSPADKAGLRTGDELLAIGGMPIAETCSAQSTSAPLAYTVRRAGHKVTLTFGRVAIAQLLSDTLNKQLSNVSFGLRDPIPSHPYLSGLILGRER